MVKELKRWNKWRKHNLNSKQYQLLVLFGFIHSPTLDCTLTDEEEEAYHQRLLDGVQKGGNDGNC